MSAICEMFHCPPDVALRQDPRWVHEIGEYRAAEQAVELFQSGEAGARQLAKRPELMALLQQMIQAQTGVLPGRAGILQDAVTKGREDLG